MHVSSSVRLNFASAFGRGGIMALALVGLAGFGLSTTTAKADEAACKAIQSAMIANTKTPYHSYAKVHFVYAAPLTVAQRNMQLPALQESETIFTGKAVFVRLTPGKWRSLPASLAQFQKSVRDSVAGLTDCQHLGDAKVDGVTAAVYAGSTAPKYKHVQTKIWISPKGEPLRSETDIEMGHVAGGNMMHQHISTRFVYNDIQAPALN
jgi:hypothetical protein